jgi:hypothetical protein
MAGHLNPDQVARYKQRSLSSAEFLAFDEHLATCEPCRLAVSDPKWLQAAYACLREDVKNQEKLGLTHLAYEQMEAYVDNEIGDADREIVESHVELCRTCQDELRDLREFRASLESRDLASRGMHTESLEASTIHATDDQSIGAFPRSASAGQKRIRFWRYPGFQAAGLAAFAILVAAIWFLPALHRKAAPTNVQLTQSVQPQPKSQSPPTQIAAGTTVAQQELHPPAELSTLIGKTGTLLSGTTAGAAFAVLTPVGTYVDEVQPLFRWQPLIGASRYKVTVVDIELHEVLESPAIAETSWKAATALQRDKIYLWQVTAFRNSEQVVAPAPPAPEARFEVVNQAQADQLTHLKLTQPSAHFRLGCAYGNAGMLDDSERELRLVSPSDADYAVAQRFIAELEALRHPARTTK